MGLVTHHQHHAVIVDSLSMKTGLFLTEHCYQGACYTDYQRWDGRKRCLCVCVRTCVPHISCCSVTHNLAFFSGVDVHEAEEDCTTEATTPTSFEPVDQSETSTVELEESSHEEDAPSQEEVSPAAKETSAVVDVSPPQEEGSSPADDGRSKTEKTSEQAEESESDARSGRQSVDELLADWREDLEAFQRMEKDEL